MTLYLVGCNHCNPPAVKKLKCPVPLVDWFGWFPEKGTVICCLSRSFQLNDTSHSSLYLFPKGSDKTWMWLKDMGVANKKWIPNNHGHISPFSPVFHHLSLSLGMDFNPWNSPYSVFFRNAPRAACVPQPVADPRNAERQGLGKIPAERAEEVAGRAEEVGGATEP